MALRLKKLDAAGAVIYGNVRDMSEFRDIGLPVFARGMAICAPNGVAYPARIGEDVCLGSSGQIPIRTGDVLVGDENGVAVIPKAMEEDVIRLLPKLVEQDEKVRQALENGSTAEEAFKLRSIQ